MRIFHCKIGLVRLAITAMMTRTDRSLNMVREREEKTSQIDFHPPLSEASVVVGLSNYQHRWGGKEKGWSDARLERRGQ